MRFWLYPNLRSEDASRLAEELRRRLGPDIAASPEEADMIVTLGGDGTVLRAVRTLHGVDRPFWAVNCGHLGYLSDCGREDALPALEKLLRGEYRLEKRVHLAGRLMDGRQVTALNELLFHRGACVHTLGVEVKVNGSLALRYRGDGLLVCTPSGSTAYNLSAGGPVLMPEMELLVLTPICPQTLSAVPIVVSSRDRVSLTWRMALRDDADEWPDLTADGQEKMLLPLEGGMEIGPALPPVALARTQDADFYGRLVRRMHWNDE